MAVYGRYLAPYYDRWECMQQRTAVINLETIADFTALQDSIGHRLAMDGDLLEIVDGPADFQDVLRRVGKDIG